jgi:hypothetical protein
MTDWDVTVDDAVAYIARDNPTAAIR